MEGENDDDNVPGTNSEVQASVTEDENDVNFSDDISVASFEIQNILMEGESNADPGNNNPGTSSEVQNEGENTYNDGAPQTSVSVIESVIANGVTSSDSDTDSTLSTNETNSIDSSSEFSPTPLKMVCTAAGPIELGNSMFLCQTTQLQQFIDQINATTEYYTPECTGKLIPINVNFLGLGGCVVITFKCSGCAERMIGLTSSVNVAFSHLLACNLAVQVTFIASGSMHSQYNKVLNQGLRMAAVTTKIFYETIKLLHPIVNTMVTEMCEMAKSEMKALDPSMVDR